MNSCSTKTPRKEQPQAGTGGPSAPVNNISKYRYTEWKATIYRAEGRGKTRSAISFLEETLFGIDLSADGPIEYLNI
jgi:hypothetical protein